MGLEYQKICIRNACKEDCKQLATWWNDGSMMAHAGFPNGLHTSGQEIEEKISRDSDETTRRFIIEYEDQSIGKMSYTNLGNQVVEIGIEICTSSYQNKGLGKIILSMFIQELFQEEYTKIVLDTNLNS